MPLLLHPGHVQHLTSSYVGELMESWTQPWSLQSHLTPHLETDSYKFQGAITRADCLVFTVPTTQETEAWSQVSKLVACSGFRPHIFDSKGVSIPVHVFQFLCELCQCEIPETCLEIACSVSLEFSLFALKLSAPVLSVHKAWVSLALPSLAPAHPPSHTESTHD